MPKGATVDCWPGSPGEPARPCRLASCRPAAGRSSGSRAGRAQPAGDRDRRPVRVLPRRGGRPARRDPEPRHAGPARGLFRAGPTAIPRSARPAASRSSRACFLMRRASPGWRAGFPRARSRWVPGSSRRATGPRPSARCTSTALLTTGSTPGSTCPSGWTISTSIRRREAISARTGGRSSTRRRSG